MTRAQTVPPGFVREDVASELHLPTAFAFLPDGRIVIAEKQGYVRVLDSSGQVRAQPLIDLRDEVNSNIDRGLVGLAIDPRFDRNGHIYLLYVYDAPGQTHNADEPRMARITRFTVQGDVAEPDSALVLLNDYEASTSYHSVNSLRFGTDGMLWVSLGDGSLNYDRSSFSYRAQDVNDLHGKLLRLDASNGAGVPGNPFFDPANPRSARSRVWAYGLRNPFRFGVHPVSGLPYVGNVGWNTYETLVRADAGANFGWPCVEGIITRPEYADDPRCAGIAPWTVTPAQFVYPHAGENASITGGAFNFGENFPEAVRGNYFFGDYSTQRIYRAELDAQGNFRSVSVFASGAGEPVDIQFGPDGALYYLSIIQGVLRRFRNANALLQHPPIAKMERALMRLASPINNTVARAGERVQVRHASDSPVGFWWAQLRGNEDDGNYGEVAQGLGDGEFVMPDFGPTTSTRHVQVTYASVSADFVPTWTRARIYPVADDGYIRSWLLTRSFSDRVIDDAPLNETNFITNSITNTLPIHSESRLINFKRYLSPNEKSLLHSTALAYAFVWLDCPDERDALLALNSDESIAAWINGKQVWFLRTEREVLPDQKDMDLPKITLRKGMNALLIKTHQTSKSNETWAFKARVLALSGTSMSDVIPRLKQ